MAGPKLSPTDVMIDQLMQNDRRLEIDYQDADRYERLAKAAARFKKTPEGTRVRVAKSWQDHKAWVILEDLPAWMTVDLAPIEVPTTLRQPSDVVEHLRAREDLTIQSSERNRALRLIEALVREARSRGHTVSATAAPRKDRNGYAYRDDDEAGHLGIQIGSDRYRLSLTQETEKVPHVASKAELARAGRGYYLPTHDENTTSHLRITIEGTEREFWQSKWSDKSGTPLETSLARILQEIELRHERADENRREEIRREEERRRQWGIARATAVERLIQSHRENVLREQVARWEFASRLRAYLHEMEARVAGMDDSSEKKAAHEWMHWARDFVEQIDPSLLELKMPSDPDPTPEALKPFMRGNPYGPW